MRKFLILGLIFLLTPLYALQIDNPQYEPLKIHPGDDVNLWFKITNNKGEGVNDIVVEITPHYPFELRQVNPTIGKATISHLNEGESDTVYFKLHVDENAPSRDYKIDVKVSYNIADEERSYEFTKVYYLPVYGIARFQVEVDNNSISPSESKAIKIKLKNCGTGNAKYLSVNFLGNDKINILGSGSYYIGFLKAKYEKTIPLTIYAVPEIDNGIYSIYANVIWVGEDGNFYNFSTPINIKVVKRIYENQPFVYLDSVEYKDNYEVTIGIANRGSSKIRHCVLTLNVNGKNHTKYIGDLDEDDYDTSIFELDNVNGTVPLNVSVNYFDDYHNEYKFSKTFVVNFVEHRESKQNNYWIIGILGVFVVLLLIYWRKRKREIESFE
ncbi:COG1361 S-layer family protein [Methanotorris formicicus]|uniref:CARDB domain-containing protein n=1 Tax=Methanotorris formicicus Mc-S-70 TaxID=647171 RepID=H1KXA1_9EURY|nr:COG1361 S-layer family protein [Methanotorris formicicus]EHP88532.1 hypothetical protein MetfoDRAFT_0424 [Methanotorris formicicus Mc-S-70]